MYRYLFLGVSALVSLARATVCAAQTPTVAPKVPTGYRVQAAFVVPSSSALTKERLELLIDIRVTDATSDEDAYGKRNALLRLVGTHNHVFRQENLERSRATLTRTNLYVGNAPTIYQLTVNYSIGMGSYNGPITFWVEAGGGKLRFLSAGGKRIAVMDSLKTAWKMVSSERGMSKDILEIACRPTASITDPGGDGKKDFEVIYTRYHFTGRVWQHKATRQFGFWEADQPFPSLSRFPR